MKEKRIRPLLDWKATDWCWNSFHFMKKKKERREKRRKQIKQGEKRRNKIRKSKEGSVQSTCNFFFLHKIGNWESEIFLQKKKKKRRRKKKKKERQERGGTLEGSLYCEVGLGQMEDPQENKIKKMRKNKKERTKKKEQKRKKRKKRKESEKRKEGK